MPLKPKMKKALLEDSRTISKKTFSNQVTKTLLQTKREQKNILKALHAFFDMTHALTFNEFASTRKNHRPYGK